MSAPPPPQPAQPPTAAKRDRQRAILEIVGAHVVGSQEELRRHLHGRGWDVTQSTLSRDLHELRLARVPTGDGMRYVATGANGTAADGAGVAAPERARLDQARATLAALLPQLFARVDGVGELAVVHTVPSGAQPIAAALDAAAWPNVLGTIGGDDTILIICRSAAARAEVSERLAQLAGG
jgi:transcriptional regulator of arginine metabolism